MLNTGEKDQVRSCKKWEEVPGRGKKKKKVSEKKAFADNYNFFTS